jgi:hypothetical protein
MRVLVRWLRGRGARGPNGPKWLRWLYMQTAVDLGSTQAAALCATPCVPEFLLKWRRPGASEFVIGGKQIAR